MVNYEAIEEILKYNITPNLEPQSNPVNDVVGSEIRSTKLEGIE